MTQLPLVNVWHFLTQVHKQKAYNLPFHVIIIEMYSVFSDFIKDKQKICIIQAENPDGDSLGSAIALSYLLKDIETTLYCPVDIPKYLRYFSDWGIVTNEFDYKADGYIIVDTAAKILLSKILDDSAAKNRLYTAPVLVLDHHETPDDLDFPHQAIIETLPACCSLIYKIALAENLPIDKNVAETLLQGILSDTLGLTSASVTSDTFRDVANLVDAGANITELEEHRREFMKKSKRILDYKADLIKRIDYSLDDTLATILIPFEDIQNYSDEYNPGVLIIEEMRMVENVKVCVAIKTYPDGKLTGKIRTNVEAPIADQIAAYFGGGGHPYAAGFRTYDTNYETILADLIDLIPKLLSSNES